MPNTPQKQRFQIPDVIDPPNTVCLTMTIPDDPIHIANITGAIYQIAFGPNYTDDDAHSAKALAQVWRRYFSTLTIGDCPIPCPPGLMGGLLEDFVMPLRVDCDCNVWVTCCDGTEKQLLTADQVKALMIGQPGEGSPQPPAGACQTYTGTLQANNRYYIPTLLSTGDTVTIEQADGLTNDGVSAGWRDYRGNVILAGFNTGGQRLNATDTLPTAFHLGLLINVGGVYYPVYSPFTVPGGVAGAQAFLEVNTQTLSIMGGSFDLQVQVCNNQSATWAHTFDFLSTPDGWLLAPIPSYQTGANGLWVSGTGWTAAYTQNSTINGYTILQILSPVVTPTVFTGMSIPYTGGFGVTSGAPLNDSMFTLVAGTPTARTTVAFNVIPPTPWAATWTPVTADQLEFDILVGTQNGVHDPGGHLEVQHITVYGNGVDPF